MSMVSYSYLFLSPSLKCSVMSIGMKLYAEKNVFDVTIKALVSLVAFKV